MSMSSRQFNSPLLPKGVEVIIPPPPYEACTFVDSLLVYVSSLVVVGSPVWFYGYIVYLYRKWTKEGNVVEDDAAGVDDKNYSSSGEKERPGISIQRWRKYNRATSKYGAALAVILLISGLGPHRSRRVGEFLGVRRWRLWDAWLNYVGFTVLRDHGENYPATASNEPEFDPRHSRAIYAFVPHGIFPFGLAFSCLPQRGYEKTWGLFRPVVATATKLFPVVRTFIAWMGGVDASRSAVSSALSQANSRLGISPGGIAEMFETYPKPGFHPNDEAALLRHRNGVFKLALQHNLPIVPVYCFGATKMFRRVQLPHFVETLSRALKISICLLFGKLGLPIPYRQRLMYVIGNSIWPATKSNLTEEQLDKLVQRMHIAFCNEIKRIFDRNKGHYGWENKTLRFV